MVNVKKYVAEQHGELGVVYFPVIPILGGEGKRGSRIHGQPWLSESKLEAKKKIWDEITKEVLILINIYQYLPSIHYSAVTIQGAGSKSVKKSAKMLRIN